MKDLAGYQLKDRHLDENLNLLQQYNVFVCSPSMDVRRARRLLPGGTRFYAAWNTVFLFGFGEGASVYGRMRAKFDTDDLYPDEMWLDTGTRHFKQSLEVYEKYAWGLVGMTKEFDGVYLDHFTLDVPPRRAPSEEVHDVATVGEDFQARYHACRDFLVERMKDIKGNIHILGNTDYAPPSLYGVCMEEHDRIPSVLRYAGMATAGNTAPLRIAWWWDPPLEMPGVHRGERLP